MGILKKTSETFHKLYEETDIDQIRFLPLLEEDERKFFKLDREHIKIYNNISDKDLKVFIRSCIYLLPALMRVTINSGIEDIYFVESVDSYIYLGSIEPKQKEVVYNG